MDSVYVKCLNGGVRRYASHHVKETFQLMGCKPLHSFQMSANVTQRLSALSSSETPVPEVQFLHTVQACMQELSYSWRGVMADFDVARKVMDREQSVCILLGGTSGCGKSTLASLLANKIGLSTVLSTDNVRHMLRSFTSESVNPILWASSYHAGEVYEKGMGEVPVDSEDRKIILGYEAQNELVFKRLDHLIGSFEERKESLIVEGVHLSIDIILKLISRHPACIPFLIYISNEAKHTERFAIRAKYMTLEPRENKYVKYFGNIRIIQNYLCLEADDHLIPKVDNTNVDRSLAIIHRTLFSCLRKFDKEKRRLEYVAVFPPEGQPDRDGTDAGEPAVAGEGSDTSRVSLLFHPELKQTRLLHEIFTKIENKAVGSKEMLKRIKQKKREGDPLAQYKEMFKPPEIQIEEDHDNTFPAENIALWYGSLGS